MRIVVFGAAGGTGRELVKQGLAGGHEIITETVLQGVDGTFKSQGLVSRALAKVLPAMRAAGVQRMILVSAFGVGDSRREAPLVPRILYALLLRDIFADKLAAEESLRASGLEWTIVRPVLLTDGAMTGSYRVGEHLSLRGLPKVSRADVAHFIIREARERACLGRVVAIVRA